MKVHELKKQIKLLENEYPEITKFDIYIEVLEQSDINFKKQKQSSWKFLSDKNDNMTHVETMGKLNILPDKKILIININH